MNNRYSVLKIYPRCSINTINQTYIAIWSMDTSFIFYKVNLIYRQPSRKTQM